MTRTLLVMTATLLLVPVAASAPWDPYTIQVREVHAGDLWSVRAEGPGGTREVVYLAEGAARAVDRFGIERDTASYRIDTYQDGELVRTERCHRLTGGEAAVRRDVLSGWSGSGSLRGSSALLGTQTSENLTEVTSFVGTCGVPEQFAGRTLREGDTLHIRELVRGERGADYGSEPAVRTEFGGRKALLFVFDRSQTSGMRIEVVMADGLPGPASVAYTGAPNVGRQALSGFTPGSGARVPPAGDASLPERHPSAGWTPFDARNFDDAALQLPFPYAEAYAALEAHPTAGAWLRARPDASLMWAQFQPQQASSDALAVEGRGQWWIAFRDGDTVASWSVSAQDRLRTPAGAPVLPRAAYVVVSFGEYEEPEAQAPPPAEALWVEDALRLAHALGVAEPAPRVTYLRLSIAGELWHMLELTEIDANGNESGRAISIDMTAGAAAAVYDAVYAVEPSRGLLAGPGAPRPVQAAAPGGALALPAPLAATATLGALALVAIAAKLLVPLYTRLRRDRLLDNPVRARLFERIRAEPGIHLAELEDFVGIGKGATRHHVDQLAKHRLVFLLDADGYRRCYVSGHVPVEAARRVAILRAGSNARVYELYAARPELTLREAARELGMSAPSVHRAKKRLEREGLLPAPSGPTLTLR